MIDKLNGGRSLWHDEIVGGLFCSYREFQLLIVTTPYLCLNPDRFAYWQLRRFTACIRIVVLLVLTLIFGGCQKASNAPAENSHCEKLINGQSDHNILIFESIDGSKMSLAQGMGGPRDLDRQCRAGGIDLKFHWRGGVDGQLLSGHSDGPKGLDEPDLQVEFWGYFLARAPDRNTIRSDTWKYQHSLELVGYPNVVAYPIANWSAPDHVPANVEDPTSWRAQFQFRGLKDGRGEPIFFQCEGARLQPAGAATASLSARPPGMTCHAYFSVSATSGGHIRVRDPKFFNRGDAIIRSVISAINSYAL